MRLEGNTVTISKAFSVNNILKLLNEGANTGMPHENIQEEVCKNLIRMQAVDNAVGEAARLDSKLRALTGFASH